MAKWTRRSLDVAALHGLGLTPEEGFVLSRLEGPLSSAEVVSLTGLAPERAEEVLRSLVSKGAVEPPTTTTATPTSTPTATTTATPTTTTTPTPTPREDAVDESDDDADLARDEAQGTVEQANHRKVYETEFRHLAREARIAAAGVEKGARLLALAFDPEPAVLRAIFANGECGFPHARIAAKSHMNPLGLDVIAQHASFFADAQVQRYLLRNPQLSELLTKRILNPKRIIESYKVSINTDVPERTRQFARAVLRAKWGTAQGEERAGLLSATDGRVLPALAGLSLDGRATQILCTRSYSSILFVQNLARFGACPPQLLAHLLKQPIARQQHLKQLLLQHPNMPKDAKKRL